MLLIMVILEDTFAPPKTAITGFFPVFKTLSIALISLCSKSPKYFLLLKNLVITAVEECFLWAAPKASLT